MRERQRDYELMFIVSPLRNGEEEINATISRVEQSITSLEGEIISTDHSAPWGRRKLAYPIRLYAEGEASRRAVNEGYYVLLRMKLATAQIDEFERQLKLNDAVMRYLITLVDYRDQAVPAVSTVVDEEEDENTSDDEE